KDNYGVIGLGRFGLAVLQALHDFGKNIIAIDKDSDRLEEVAPFVSSVYLIKSISKEAFEEAGIGDCDTVIVGFSSDVGSSVLAPMNCIELGVDRVISKTRDNEHGKILEKLGAQAVFPEEDSGKRIVMNLICNANLDMLVLSSDFSIISIDMNPIFAGKTILELNWRRKHNVNVIAVMNGSKTNATITPDLVLEAGCRVVLSGAVESLEAFRKINSEGEA
ncbi:MAG TPA: TrkA family potassium uptake protein, partial [Spirochaetaceae bacterium]|nr:TrkA family potassium uptake protein [Spirochaetaceae bacterium]